MMLDVIVAIEIPQELSLLARGKKKSFRAYGPVPSNRVGIASWCLAGGTHPGVASMQRNVDQG